MKLQLRTYPNPILKQVAMTVDLSHGVSQEIKDLAADMAETMYATHGVGLAAPQVGHSLRLVVLDIDQDQRSSKLRVFINPEIISSSGKRSSREGCLSVPFVLEFIERPEKIRVRYVTLEGEAKEEECTGDLAVCLSHEIDHLNGILFIDRMSKLKKKLAMAQLQKPSLTPALKDLAANRRSHAIL